MGFIVVIYNKGGDGNGFSDGCGKAFGNLLVIFNLEEF